MIRRSALLLVLAAVLATGAIALPEPAGAQEREVDRALVISIPTVAWPDLGGPNTPHLDALLDESAVAAMSVRGVNRGTSAGDGYTTLGAGSRARGVASVDGLAFSPGELYLDEPAADVFHRRTGVRPRDRLFSLAIPGVTDRNRGLPYDTEVGSLADVLAEADVRTGVVANADGGLGLLPDDVYGREAVEGLMDGRGLVQGGQVDGALVVEDRNEPFGIRLDLAAVTSAFDEVWRDRSVVLVEASDLVRADTYRPLATTDRRLAMRRRALRSADELVRQLMQRVDPERDAVLVVGPYHARRRVHLTVAGLRSPGLEPGLLRSPTTRRSGFVGLVDVAPTILDLLGIDAPSDMEGRPFERGAGGGDADDRRDMLAETDRAAAFRDRMVAPATVVFIALNVLLCLLAGVALVSSRWRSGRAVAAFAAVSLLGFLPSTYLAGLLPFYRWGEGVYWLFLLGCSVAIGALAMVVGRRNGLDPLLLVLMAVLGLLVVDVLLGAPLQLNTVYGYSPTVGGRFAGFGNLAFAQVAATSILLAGLLAHRIGVPRGALVGVGVLVLVLVVDGAPMWGSDVGGVLTLVPAAGLAATLLLGWRFQWRTVAALGAGALVAVGLFAALDLARPSEDRTHLGRLVERVGDEGFGAFETVALRKLGANLSVLTSSVWTLMVPVVILFVSFLVWRVPGRLREVQDGNPELRAALAGLFVAGILGFALNDSGIAVPGVMLGVVNTSLVYLVVRTTE